MVGDWIQSETSENEISKRNSTLSRTVSHFAEARKVKGRRGYILCRVVCTYGATMLDATGVRVGWLKVEGMKSDICALEKIAR